MYPAKHFVVAEEKIEAAMQNIRHELDEWAPQLSELERQRITQQVTYDLEMIGELGYCSGIENYSRHFEHREVGTPPFTLLDFSRKISCSLLTKVTDRTASANAMFKGDLARKKNLVDFGFRLPSAYKQTIKVPRV